MERYCDILPYVINAVPYVSHLQEDLLLKGYIGCMIAGYHHHPVQSGLTSAQISLALIVQSMPINA